MMRQALFIFNFRKYIRGVLQLGIGIGLLIICINGLNYLYQEPDYSARVMWKSFYSQEDIDTVFLGSSHVYLDVDVQIIDEHFGCNSFDMSTSLQRLQESYYNLLEANDKYDIKKAFVELYYLPSIGFRGDYSDISSMKNSWRNTDNMKTGIPRLKGILAMNDYEHYLEALIPFIRYRAYIFDRDYIADKTSIKKSDNYINYIYHEDFPENGFCEVDLSRKGFWYSTRKLESPTCWQPFGITEMKITDDAERYLKKIIHYCRDHGIELVFFISPVYETLLISTEGYDVYLDSIKKIAKENQIPIYDFNLIKKKYLDLQINDFYDIEHLNSQGAVKFTKMFCNVLDGNYGDTDVYFYSSFKEKMMGENSKLYGAYWINSSDNRIMKIAAGSNPDMEFRVILAKADKKLTDSKSGQVLIQDYDTNRELILPKDEHGTGLISSRIKGQENKVEILEFLY